MKVIHIESGLGNQMLDYCDLLSVKYANPDEEYYIETIIYDIPEASKKICQWNGYELERIFGIKEKNIKEKFSDIQWENIIKKVADSKFWDDNWRYSDEIVDAFKTEGLNLKNIYSRPHKSERAVPQKTIDFTKTRLGYTIKRAAYKSILKKRVIGERNLFIKSTTDDYTGHTLQFCYKNRGIEKIDKDIRKAFVFPEITDPYNKKMEKLIKDTNSVAIHVRRGDMLSANSHFYRYGYFKRAVAYIKKHVENPFFFFFCDPESSDWVKQNLDTFKLRNGRERIEFITGNAGIDSYRDMQLMSKCKHAVITNSSFGFWGAYLMENPNKITCSPDIRINTTHSF